VSEKNFEFLGYLKEQSDMVDYYKSSIVYVAPTLYENLPIRVLEAMACGVPVVASNVCAIPEAIDNGVNGILVPPGAVEALSKAICLLLSDETLRKRIGDNARKTVLEKFDCSVNTFKTIEIYKQIEHFCQQK
jgi:glycosyltransferase involved in cell wall biosynthesis